jgi:hypothetical protein
MSHRAVPAAYMGAIEITCPTCRAEPGAYCARPAIDGGPPRVRRVPCVARGSRSAPEPDTALPRPHRRSNGPARMSLPQRDFGEPIHRRQDDDQ